MSKERDLTERLIEARDLIKNDGMDEELEPLLIHSFDDNYYCNGVVLSIFNNLIEVEGIWTDNNDEVYVHVDSKEMEADIRFISLSRDNQLTIVNMLLKDNMKEIKSMFYDETLPKERFDEETINKGVKITEDVLKIERIIDDGNTSLGEITNRLILRHVTLAEAHEIYERFYNNRYNGIDRNC